MRHRLACATGRIFALGVSLGLALGITGAARANCPDVPAQCALGAVGRQGTCWDVRRLSCKGCGPKHCPTPPQTVPRTYDFPCARTIQADRQEVDGCSNPLTDSLSSLYKELFYPACVQHDTCYHNNVGIKKGRCDDDFKANMAWICDSYYAGKSNEVQRQTCQIAVGTWYTAVSTAPLATTLWQRDQAWTAAHCK